MVLGKRGALVIIWALYIPVWASYRLHYFPYIKEGKNG